MHSELEYREDDPHHEGLTQVLHFCHREDRKLAENGQHEGVEKGVPEDVDRCWLLIVTQRTIAKPESRNIAMVKNADYITLTN